MKSLVREDKIKILVWVTSYFICQIFCYVLFPSHLFQSSFLVGLSFLVMVLWQFDYHETSPLKSNHLETIIYELFKSLSNRKKSDNIYQIILESAVKAIPTAQKGSIVRYEGNDMVFVAFLNYDKSYLDQLQVKTDECILYRYTQGKMDHGVIINDLLEETILSSDSDDVRGEGFCSVCAPVIIDGKAVASIHLDNTKSISFTEDNLRILEIFAYETSNILKLYESLDLLQNLAERDEMTSTYNRRHGDQVIERLIMEQTSFLLIMMDLNSLKKVNDLHGHQKGDEYIITFTHAISKLIPPKTTFARYGGDEFLLIIPFENGVYGELLMQDIMNELSTLPSDAFPLPITYSYGMVSVPEECDSLEKIIKLADTRMYYNKQFTKKATDYKEELHSSDESDFMAF